MCMNVTIFSVLLLLCTSIIQKLFRKPLINHLFVFFLLSIVHYLYVMMLLHTQCQHIFQINPKSLVSQVVNYAHFIQDGNVPFLAHCFVRHHFKCYDFMYSHTSFQLAIRNKRFQDCFVLFCCVRHTILYTHISTYVSDK